MVVTNAAPVANSSVWKYAFAPQYNTRQSSTPTEDENVASDIHCGITRTLAIHVTLPTRD